MFNMHVETTVRSVFCVHLIIIWWCGGSFFNAALPYRLLLLDVTHHLMQPWF